MEFDPTVNIDYNSKIVHDFNSVTIHKSEISLSTTYYF